MNLLTNEIPGGTIELSQNNIMLLSILATVGIVVMWCAFWIIVWRSKESVSGILLNPSFFKTVAVIGVIAAVAVLSLAGRLDSNVTGAVLSGIVGYVLGTLSSREKNISS